LFFCNALVTYPGVGNLLVRNNLPSKIAQIAFPIEKPSMPVANPNMKSGLLKPIEGLSSKAELPTAR